MFVRLTFRLNLLVKREVRRLLLQTFILTPSKVYIPG